MHADANVAEWQGEEERHRRTERDFGLDAVERTARPRRRPLNRRDLHRERLAVRRPLFDEFPLSGTFVSQRDDKHTEHKAETSSADANSGTDAQRACFHWLLRPCSRKCP